jgi:hypothetical protein
MRTCDPSRLVLSESLYDPYIRLDRFQAGPSPSQRPPNPTEAPPSPPSPSPSPLTPTRSSSSFASEVPSHPHESRHADDTTPQVSQVSSSPSHTQRTTLRIYTSGTDLGLVPFSTGVHANSSGPVSVALLPPGSPGRPYLPRKAFGAMSSK